MRCWLSNSIPFINCSLDICDVVGPVGAAVGGVIGAVLELISLFLGFVIDEVEDLLKKYAPSWLTNIFFDSEFDEFLTIVNSTPYDLYVHKKDYVYNIKDSTDCFPDCIPAGRSVLCRIKQIIAAKVTTTSTFADLYVAYEVLDNDENPLLQIFFYQHRDVKGFKAITTDTLQNRQPLGRGSFEDLTDCCNIVKTEITSGFSDYLLVISGAGKNNYQMYSQSPLISIKLTKYQDLFLYFDTNVLLENLGTAGRHPDAKLVLNQLNWIVTQHPQSWYVTDDGYIKHKDSLDNPALKDYVLEIVDGNPNEGAQLTLGVKTGGLHQKWSFGSLGVDGGTIVSKLNNYVIDVADSKFEDGAKIIMRVADGGDNQSWTTHC